MQSVVRALLRILDLDFKRLDVVPAVSEPCLELVDQGTRSGQSVAHFLNLQREGLLSPVWAHLVEQDRSCEMQPPVHCLMLAIFSQRRKRYAIRTCVLYSVQHDELYRACVSRHYP